MTQKKKIQLGELDPKYNFNLNPYPQLRFSKCPDCNNKTRQRKLPLLIHVNPMRMIALNYVNRYCERCDLLISHKDEIDRINLSAHTHWEELKLPVGAMPVRFLRSAWSLVTGH